MSFDDLLTCFALALAYQDIAAPMAADSTASAANTEAVQKSTIPGEAEEDENAGQPRGKRLKDGISNLFSKALKKEQ
jgi:hypothetical protein